MKRNIRLAPRNPLVAPAKFRKAGAHEKSNKAHRRTDKIALRRGDELAGHRGRKVFHPGHQPKCRCLTTLRPVFRIPQPHNKENDMQQENIRRFLEQSRDYFEQAAQEQDQADALDSAYWRRHNHRSMPCRA